MINLKKQRIIVAFLFCFLIVIALTPPVLLNHHNKNLLNVPNVSNVASDISIDNEMVEKFDLTDKTIVEKNQMVESWIKCSLSKENQAELVAEVEQQILILQKLKALPVLSLSKSYQVNIYKRTYVNMQNPTLIANMWNIEIDYKDIFLTTYMDTESSALYNLNIQSKTGSLNYNRDDIYENGYLEYLQLVTQYKESNQYDISIRCEDDVIQYLVSPYISDSDNNTSFEMLQK